MDIDALKTEYHAGELQCERLQATVKQQLEQLLTQNEVVLGVPLEGRIKTWDSIQEKLDRKRLNLNSLTELDDLVGVRAILLFHSDLLRADRLIRSTFDVISGENTGDRLTESQFGYQSQHYVVCLPSTWLAMPSLRDLGNLKVEIQVRTLAQHVWAAASHKLQYKDEESVPPPLRRTINRISALLETVDLEFDRVLEERKAYVEESTQQRDEAELLNVDNLSSLLDSLLPTVNKSAAERYDELLSDLSELNVRTVADLRRIWSKHGKTVLESDAKDARRRAVLNDYYGTSEERIKRNVFRTHVGLVRRALKDEFGDAFQVKLKVTKAPARKRKGS